MSLDRYERLISLRSNINRNAIKINHLKHRLHLKSIIHQYLHDEARPLWQREIELASRLAKDSSEIIQSHLK